MNIIRPAKLKKGDRVGIISPSNSIQSRKEKFEKAVQAFQEKLEVEVVVAPHALGQYYYSSGTVEERLSDFHQMLTDTSIKAIIFSVGGNTAIDLLEGLDYELIQQNPKIIAGISDATTLLNPIFLKTGLITFLGLEFGDFGIESMTYEFEQIKKTWFAGNLSEITPNSNWKDFDNNPTQYKGWQTIKAGVAKGRLLGGTFDSLGQLFGSEYYPDLTNNIFVFEAYKYNKRKIHQRLVSMRLKGEFEKLAGMIVGYCIGSDDPKDLGNERDMKELLLEVTTGYNFPIMQIGEIGHNVENMMLPIGAMATMDATNLKFTIDEAVVLI